MRKSLEAISNRWADDWMQNANRSPWFRRFLVPPEEFMDGRYILRFVGWTIGFFVAIQIALQALTVVLFVLAVTWTDKRLRIPVPSFGSLVSKEVHGGAWLEIIMAISVFVLLLLELSWLVYRAYYWNRRARRLQSDPPSPMRDPDALDGVWPPPPQL